MHTESANCSTPYALGMESRGINDSQITALSFYAGWEAFKGRLNNDRGWASADINPWIQVDMMQPTVVTGIITQGGPVFGGWINTLWIQYGDTQDMLQYISDDSEPKVSTFI